ncbi:MAG: exodeoxyribonuclease VII large subunit, partial [Coriobacteriia bacterium]|nr:exodeoxyribonuclease VII large subunit [Coriobacteriia bacterium]
PMQTPERPVSVSDAMSLAKGVLEGVRIRVLGEVSEATIKPGYKAVYFSLKDEAAVMPCLMWRDAYDACGAALVSGRLVEVSGYFTAYAPKGRLQFQVRSLSVAGEGVLRLQVAELARKLEAEGLMDASRKRTLPGFPLRVGLVTSPRGKAVHDVLRTLARRYPLAEVVIAGVQVEGDCAAAEIVRGLRAIAAEPDVDVVILARGGGSYEDLMPFNAEEVARAVVASPMPVVTGIGHEPDTCIADMVADLRASTPTAAAEAVAPAIDDVRRSLSVLERSLGRALSARVRESRHRLRMLASRPLFTDRSVLLAQRLQALDIVAQDLARVLPERVRRQRELVTRSGGVLLLLGSRLSERERVRLEHSRERTVAAGRAIVASAEQQMAASAARLEDLSPLAILGRGFAVCYETGGGVVRDAGQVSPGDHVTVRVARGHLGCTVDTTTGSEG